MCPSISFSTGRLGWLARDFAATASTSLLTDWLVEEYDRPRPAKPSRRKQAIHTIQIPSERCVCSCCSFIRSFATVSARFCTSSASSKPSTLSRNKFSCKRRFDVQIYLCIGLFLGLHTTPDLACVYLAPICANCPSVWPVGCARRLVVLAIDQRVSQPPQTFQP